MLRPDFASYPKAHRTSFDTASAHLWETHEGIEIQSIYPASLQQETPDLSSIAGTPPFLRGPYASMYAVRPWTIRQYAGFSTAEESNRFYKKNLAAGQKGLSVAFDLATHRGYDSDHPLVIGDVGKAGVAIDTVEDMKLLFDGIPLDKISVSMTMNGAVLPILAFFIVAAEEMGYQVADLRGTIQNDILKEFIVRNTYIYPPQASMRIVGDVFTYLSAHLPKFNSISVSGYHMLEAGASADLEVAYTLSNGIEYIRTGIASGLAIDRFAPRISFFWGVGMDHFMEVAKLRVARKIWSELVAKFDPTNIKSQCLRAHCQTSGWSLTAQAPYNNVGRTCLEALSAVLGGTQSLHTNALDEALSLPSDFSAAIARDTQIFLQKETDLCQVIDPYGGSYYIETLTQQLYQRAMEWIDEIESSGGMTAAIEKGIPKRRIEQAAARRQAMIDQGQEKIVGVNVFASDASADFELLNIDNEAVIASQLQRIQSVKQNRDDQQVQQMLDEIKRAARSTSRDDNLLSRCADAARSRATLGEISMAMESVFSRFEAKISLISGVYARAMQDSEAFQQARQLSNQFATLDGRRPRIMIAKLGQDGHDRGARIIASSFADVGFDVDIGPLFQTPEEAATQAAENDVHILGISSMAGAHKTLVPKTMAALEEIGRSDIQLVVGGIIPDHDHTYLKEIGVLAIFGPGTSIPHAAITIINQLLKGK
ncbi:MAG: methylmalonyl-CoA mutase [Saprospiraceae bacterium]|nr:methylmalonyl-CoA mutase [Saprospiraceae bacterium]